MGAVFLSSSIDPISCPLKCRLVVQSNGDRNRDIVLMSSSFQCAELKAALSARVRTNNAMYKYHNEAGVQRNKTDV